MLGFRPADPATVADLLDTRHVHVWRLPHRAEQGRAPFRDLLARYLGVAPGTVVFRDAPGGRPYIAHPHGDLAINWSHSGDQAVLALARGLPILGVDVESPRPRTRALALADRFFHPLERDDLAALPPAQREAAFLKLWTAKEAVLKALGEGLRFGLDRVVFRLRDDRLVPGPFAEAAGTLAEWHLERLDDVLGHACVAWRGDRRQVAWFTLADEDVELSGRA